MKNALLGYTYQHYVALFLLSKMDVEREINKITLEAVVNHQFDDISLEAGKSRYFLQIKDFDKVDLASLRIIGNAIVIKKKSHQLSADINVIFFREIDFKPNSNIFGLPTYKLANVYVVSLDRSEIEKKIGQLYQKDIHRKRIIEQLLADHLDNRQLAFEKFRLPAISVYNTRMSEKTVKLSRKLLDFEKILFIEGKPGVGKSHLVEVITGQFKNNTLYRFWISNQDAQYKERLLYANFLSDLSKKLFHDYKDHSENEILTALKDDGKTLIIDGLDHVENYNKDDLPLFLDIIERARLYCKVIVLSRPLQATIHWKKQVLTNWNQPQTQKVLKDLYLIDDFMVADRIYKVTSGYPILVKYVAQQYKQDGQLPANEKFDSINSYYDRLLKEEKGKQALGLFICSKGFLMRSEFKLFLMDYALSFVEEFLDQHPYLFEIRLNRVTLFHDSLITYLRNSGINYAGLQADVNHIVCESILSGDKRFQSRIGHFDISKLQVKSIFSHYASMKNFKAMMKGIIDFEALREFYTQLRHLLIRLSPEDLKVNEYYDFTLIYNLSQRDFISHMRPFQYTYVRALRFNAYTDEDITSSKYLFAMWYYVKNRDASLLLNITSDDRYDTEDFYQRLTHDLKKEDDFFEFQKSAFKTSKVRQVLHDTRDTEYRTYLGYVLINLYLHEANREVFPELYMAIQTFVNGREQEGINLLTQTLANNIMNDRQSYYVLNDSKTELLAYGIDPAINDYVNLSLKKYLIRHGGKKSFTLWPEILSYLRLSLHRKKKIDLKSISSYWTKYHQRGDITLFPLDRALTVFEKKGWVNWPASVRLITDIQEVSEKGYSGLLGQYIMEHEPAFILTLLSVFQASELRISWFDLQPDYLNVLPDEIYRLQLREMMSYHRDGKIPARDIQNLLSSAKLPLLQRDLKRYNFKLWIKEGDSLLPLLDQLKLDYITYAPDAYDKEGYDPEKRFAQGILDDKNTHLIKTKKLSPAQVSTFSDANYWGLSKPQLFKVFPKRRIKRGIKTILFNALTTKSRHGEYFHGTWEMPGTILSIFDDSGIPISKAMFDSFMAFLELSLIDFDPVAV